MALLFPTVLLLLGLSGLSASDDRRAAAVMSVVALVWISRCVMAFVIQVDEHKVQMRELFRTRTVSMEDVVAVETGMAESLVGAKRRYLRLLLANGSIQVKSISAPFSGAGAADFDGLVETIERTIGAG